MKNKLQKFSEIKKNLKHVNKIFILICLICVIRGNILAQDRTIDSLNLALKNAKHDTIKLRINCAIGEASSVLRVGYWDSLYQTSKKLSLLRFEAICLNNIASSYHTQNNLLKAIEYYKKTLNVKAKFENESQIAFYLNYIGKVYKALPDFTNALKYYNESLKLYQKIGDSTGIGNSLNNIGAFYSEQGNSAQALEYYFKSLKIRELINNKQQIAFSLNNIGVLYYNQGQISLGLDYYHKSLKYLEAVNDKNSLATSLSNVAVIYHNQGDLSKALEFYLKSLKFTVEIGDKGGEASTLSNIGSLYVDQNKISEAMQSYQKSLKINQELGYKKGITTCLINIGTIYEQQGDLKHSIEMYQKGLAIAIEVNDEQLISFALNHIANTMLETRNFSEALTYAKRSMQLSKKFGYPYNINKSANTLKLIYQKQNKYKEAFEMYELEIKMRDSINNQETQKAAVKKQMQYDYEKQEAVAKAEHKSELEKQQAVADEKSRKQKIVIFSVAIGLLLVIVFAGYVFKTLRATRKQKILIEHKNKEIEEKQKEILDSIRYAKRIQMAQIPSEKRVAIILQKLKKP